jgi:uncharacterized cysteine cluster protein YcgN (CxxCxxCC family)
VNINRETTEMTLRYNRITKIETAVSTFGYNVLVTYEDGEKTYFGNSRLLKGANKMCTEYANRVKKNPACVSENLEVIKMAAT